MSHRVESSTPLAPVVADGGQVWLRRNIRTETREDVGGEGAREVSVADEVTFVDPAVDEAYASAHADELWVAHQYDGMSTAEVIAALGERISEQESALLELGDLIGGDR